MIKKKRTRTVSINSVRLTICIPTDIFPYFEKQRKLPQHNGNRSSYIRSLIIEAMNSR